jgi:hypothetical protein
MKNLQFKTLQVDGLDIFYREAGDKNLFDCRVTVKEPATTTHISIVKHQKGTAHFTKS